MSVKSRKQIPQDPKKQRAYWQGRMVLKLRSGIQAFNVYFEEAMQMGEHIGIQKEAFEGSSVKLNEALEDITKIINKE